MKRRLLTLTMLVTLSTTCLFAQETKTSKSNQEKDVTTTSESKQAQSMLLNASSDNGPREINIGLPTDIAGTAILENGMPVTYDGQSQAANRIWRQDGSFSKVRSMNLYKTAIYNGSIGVSMSTESGRGSSKFNGAVNFQTNSFGLLRGSLKLSGPLKKGFEYQMSAFLNYDPTNMRASFDRFLDKTQILRGFLNKKYSNGQIGIQYKFANSQGSSSLNQNPYIYHADGTVSKYSDLSIGTTSYIEKSGMAYPQNIYTGVQESWDLMNETGSTSHIVDILGDHDFKNGMKLNYTGRLHYAESGFWNPNLGTIFSTENQGDNNRYVYSENLDQIFTGNVQKGQMAVSNKWGKFGAFGRMELSKNSKQHDWLIGLNGNILDAHDAFRAVYGTYMTIEDNPTALVHQKLVDGQWVNSNNKYGCENPNSAIQYYDGLDSKSAIYATDKWRITKRLTADLGVRMELQHINGYWAPKSCRGKSADGANILIGREKIKKDWFNKSGAANFVYNAFRNSGFTADILYAEIGGNLSSYAQAVDPELKQSQTQAYSVGVYFNRPIISVTSKLNYIKRTNYSFAGNFENPNNVTEIQRATINYDVQTLGWTTDVDFKPFKGFNLHFLMTLQNPKYGNFDFTMFEQRFNYTDNTVRGVSKVLLEIEPSYQWSKFRIWGSARYFSKQYACFSDALYFAARWETFAGLDYKYNKNINFSLNVVNLLNQTGAQGNIAGANTITEEAASQYYDKPLAGTFIRPFTLEFKTIIKF